MDRHHRDGKTVPRVYDERGDTLINQVRSALTDAGLGQDGLMLVALVE
ncbi:MAG: hypothetical protein ACRD0K_25340 [Egibacteraceae bacterium]